MKLRWILREYDTETGIVSERRVLQFATECTKEDGSEFSVSDALFAAATNEQPKLIWNWQDVPTESEQLTGGEQDERISVQSFNN